MESGVVTQEPKEFGDLLRYYRTRAGRSRHSLCNEVGCDPSYGTRIESGEREPPRRHIVEAFARGLKLPPKERNRLLTAAGYIPRALEDAGGWDELWEAVAGVLTNFHLTEAERAEFRETVLVMAKWRSNGHGSVRGVV